MIDFNEIKKLVQERDVYLALHPELQPLQDEINTVLNKAGNNTQRRNQALQELMLNTWYEIVEAANSLNKACKK